VDYADDRASEPVPGHDANQLGMRLRPDRRESVPHAPDQTTFAPLTPLLPVRIAIRACRTAATWAVMYKAERQL
jgi:hypothetical protein